MGKRVLYETAEDIVKGYRINESEFKRKVYLRARILKTGVVSLFYYGGGEGRFVKQKTGAFLRPELTQDIKRDNEEILRRERLKVDALNSELERTGKNFVGGENSKKWLSEFAKDCGKSVTNSQIGAVVSHVIKYNHDSDIMLSDISENFLRGFIEYLKGAYSLKASGNKPLKKSSQYSMLKALLSIMRKAVNQELISENPFDKIIRNGEMIKTEKAQRCYLDVEEVEKLINTECNKRPDVKKAFLFCCFTGLRISDVSALTWNHIKHDKDLNYYIEFDIKKTKKHDILPVSSYAMQFLNKKEDKNEPIYDMPVNPSYILKKWMAKAGINKYVTFHTSRHTAATMLLNMGVQIEVVQKILGHSNLSTTQIYAEIIDKSKRNAMDVLDKNFKKMHHEEK